ncbi:MAG: lipid-A-disaccharide synthase N-terminal domain-containing protein [Chlamydiales bacterium]|nr:lipid-A-disaccharide synthase N-terminal domain-containing protein [Chlamydiales bacterium]
MSDESIRYLLYPLGFIAQAAFALRFLIQWKATEQKKQSVTPKAFWHLSLLGNILLLVHSLIQLQLPMSLIQSQNSVLSWRNINLLGPQNQRIRFSTVIVILGAAAASTSLFFLVQDTPTTPTHLFGIIGMILFALRFWVQWWEAEKTKTSTLNKPFWWLSIVGAIMSGIYFFIIHDWVNCIGPMLSLIPYGRNLYFLRKATP